MDRWYKNGKALLDEIAGSNSQTGEAQIWFTGQHGFIVSLGGLVFYIDVILNDLLDESGKSLWVYPPPFDPAWTQKVDYVLCTHNHSDHLNLATLVPLAQANPGTRFIVPAPWKHLLIDAGIAEPRILPAKAGENIQLSSNFSLITPVPAFHTRYISDDGEKDANGDYVSLGFILKGEGFSIYHSGDTWVTPSLVQTLKTHAPLSIAMLPINGTDWKRTEEMITGNMSPLDAVKLACAIPIDMVIPSHYDMIAHNSENPARFADLMYTMCPHKRFHIFAPGERFIFR